MTPNPLTRLQEVALVTPAEILVATDLTEDEYLLPHAIAQAKASGSRLTIIHAILPANVYPFEAGYIPYEDQGASDDAAQSALEKIARYVELQGISCDVSFKHGFAEDVIREKIKSTRPTRLIMGSHGRGKWGQMALGSVANELLGSVSIPIFVVGPQAVSLAVQASPKRILHPVSLNGDYKKSFDVAVDLAEAYHAELTLLHVLDRDTEESINPERTLNSTTNALMSLLPKGREIGGRIHARAVCGSLVDEVLKAAKETNADWIVLGVDGGFPYLPFQNSKAYKVIAEAPCGVLTIRHEPFEDVDKNVREMHLSSVID
jgi:nucleotide-binding universal stress UspA family protein